MAEADTKERSLANGPTVVAEDAYPKRFGPYLLLSAFAQGGMGEVYLAKSGGIEGIDRLCVLKKLRPDVAKNREYLGRFIDEARVVVQLSHANIAHVFDVGAVGDDHYLAMEYVSGANVREIQLRAAREEAHGLDVGLAGFMVCQVLDALDYAHRHKHPITGQPLHVVHRDVSPQNVMVSFEGEVKLIDFGLAASDLKEEHTESQVVMGKVAYMAPEQARGDPVDARTDQYAAAIVFYELLVGDRFYGDKNNYEIWQVVGQGGFVPRKWTSLDPEIIRILGRALAADKEQRYPTCGDFKEDLELFVRSRFPQTSKRTLRELLERLFVKDQEAERRFLGRFAEVSAAQARIIIPGKAKSFVATDGSSSAELSSTGHHPASGEPDPDEASPPHAGTDTQGELPPSGTRAEATEWVDRKSDVRPSPLGAGSSSLPGGVPSGDETGAVMKNAYPTSRGPLAAGVILLLLLGAGGLAFWPRGATSGDEAPPGPDSALVDPSQDTEAAPSPPPEPAELKSDPPPPEATAPSTERAATAGEAQDSPAGKGAKSAQKRAKATSPKPREGEDVPSTSPPPDKSDTATPQEGTPAMRVLAPIQRHVMHKVIAGKKWRNGIADTEIADVMRRCKGYLNDTQRVLADSLIREGKNPVWEGGRATMVNRALGSCEREAARKAETLEQ